MTSDIETIRARFRRFPKSGAVHAGLARDVLHMIGSDGDQLN